VRQFLRHSPVLAISNSLKTRSNALAGAVPYIGVNAANEKLDDSGFAVRAPFNTNKFRPDLAGQVRSEVRKGEQNEYQKNEATAAPYSTRL
jgi:hypothetical protein